MELPDGTTIRLACQQQHHQEHPSGCTSYRQRLVTNIIDAANGAVVDLEEDMLVVRKVSVCRAPFAWHVCLLVKRACPSVNVFHSSAEAFDNLV